MTPDTPTPPDVKYETINFTLTGAFMIALTRQPESALPTTVEGFVTLLGNYARAHAGTLTSETGRIERSPDIPDAPVAGDKFAVTFTPLEGDGSADPLGIWAVETVLEVRNVRRGAKMRLFHNTADHVNIRLPEPHNIAAKEDLALEHDAAGTRFDNMPYIEPYFEGEMSSMQFVWANVGDYTTRSCR